MGKGNVSVRGPYEAVFYIPNEFLSVYREDAPFAEEPQVRLLNDVPAGELSSNKWLYDDEGSANEEEDVLECIMSFLETRFHSMNRAAEDKWISRTQRVIMENSLFNIAIEDNQTSLAVELLRKKVLFDDRLLAFQKRHFERYRDALKRALLKRVPYIAFPTSAWTSGIIHAKDVMTAVGV